MKTNDMKFLLQQNDFALHDYLRKSLMKYYPPHKIINKPYEYLIAQGSTPYALVAHLDTVRKYPPINLQYRKVLHTIKAYGEPLGADDRAGVCIILSILKDTKLRPTIIFTHGEEVGATGAIQLVKDYPKAPFSANYLIEIDRQGRDEVVFYRNHCAQMSELFKKFGFKTEYGTFSDISILSPAWRIMGANVSAGYFNEHTIREYVRLDFMQEIERKLITFMNKNHINLPYFERPSVSLFS